MRNLRKLCSIIHFRKKHGFYGGHFEIGHNDQLLDESSIGNLILTSGMYLNQIAPLMETFVLKLYAKKLKKIKKFEKFHFATDLQYPK